MLAFDNHLKHSRMENKKIFQSINLIGSVSLALTVPLIIFKVFRAVRIKKGLNALNGKVVVITGASSGLGEALAHEFYKQGCQIVLCARRRQELDRVCSEIVQSHPSISAPHPIIIPLDLSDINSLPDQVNKILKITGHIDILVNNGGISQRATAVETKPEVDIKIMTVNYFGSVAMTKAVLPGMVKRKSGHIVFVSSIQGLFAIPGRSAYSASKHAMQAFSDSLRAEVAADNIQVTIISPGYVRTKLSLNALTGSGGNHGEMDDATASGYTPEYTSEEIVRAVAQNNKELILCPIVPKVAIFLRKFLPSIYFYVMEKRAKKLSFKQ